MTALKEYQRLEAAGLWRASAKAQRVDVIVSIGDATLTISDMRDRPLTHWSLAAIERANPGERPAIYHPDGDPQETLEFGADEGAMIDAIEKLRRAIGRGRPRKGRLRLTILGVSAAAAVTAAAIWLPDMLRGHAVSVLPQVKYAAIGTELRAEIETLTGPVCSSPAGDAALARLASRLPGARGPGQILVLRSATPPSLPLPGGTVLVSRTLVENYEEPDVLAGHVVTARLRAERMAPLRRVLEGASLWDVTRLLTTGELPRDVLRDHASALLTSPPEPLPTEALLAGFKRWAVRARPYAYAVDETGETTLGLIEADPFAVDVPPPLLSDADWLQLQGICGR